MKKFFYVRGFILHILISSSLLSYSQNQTTVDSSTFSTFSINDTSFTNFISPSLNAVYRKTGNKSVTALHESQKYRVLIQDSNKLMSRFILDTSMASLSVADSGAQPTSFRLYHGKAELNAKETWFNGDWIKLPTRAKYPSLLDSVPPEGGLFYSSQTGSLLKSDGLKSHPAYWEYPDGNEIDPYILETNWTKQVGYNNLPLIRIRHPRNVTGLDLKSESRSRDFSIVPYQYGMAIDYNGVVECWVGEWSIHKGHNYNTDLERNGNGGWGGVLWVGDDEDMGGIRATARNGSDAYYSEISSEMFSDASHGDLRLRVVDSADKISFVHGKRGSKNITINIQNNKDTAIIEAGLEKQLAFQTNGIKRMILTTDGKLGIGTSQPTSILDIEEQKGYEQLRLRTKYTPVNSTDPNGKIGDVSWDNDFIYIKTDQGWKRTKMESF